MKHYLLITLMLLCSCEKDIIKEPDYYSLIANKKWNYVMQTRGADTIFNNLNIWFKIEGNFWIDNNGNIFPAEVISKYLVVTQITEKVIYEIGNVNDDSLVLNTTNRRLYGYTSLHYKR